MMAAAAESAYDAHVEIALDRGSTERVPITDWKLMSHSIPKHAGKRLPGGERMIEINVAIGDDESVPSEELIRAIGHALRADSPDAPSTHAEAMRLGEVWVQSENKELDNHRRNESWETITKTSCLPGAACINSFGFTR